MHIVLIILVINLAHDKINKNLIDHGKDFVMLI